MAASSSSSGSPQAFLRPTPPRGAMAGVALGVTGLLSLHALFGLLGARGDHPVARAVAASAEVLLAPFEGLVGPFEGLVPTADAVVTAAIAAASYGLVVGVALLVGPAVRDWIAAHDWPGARTVADVWLGLAALVVVGTGAQALGTGGTAGWLVGFASALTAPIDVVLGDALDPDAWLVRATLAVALLAVTARALVLAAGALAQPGSRDAVSRWWRRLAEAWPSQSRHGRGRLRPGT